MHTLYILYIAQLVIATAFVILANVSLFQMGLLAQIINAIRVPIVFYFLIKLTSYDKLMDKYVNNSFEKYFAIAASTATFMASMFTIIAAFF